MTAAVTLAGGVVVLVGGMWTAFSTIESKADKVEVVGAIEAAKMELEEDQRVLAGAQARTHKLDFLDTRRSLDERELRYLESKEEEEGLTVSEQRRLDKLIEDLDFYDEQEMELREELMELE